jgi:hypothetical protein
MHGAVPHRSLVLARLDLEKAPFCAAFGHFNTPLFALIVPQEIKKVKILSQYRQKCQGNADNFDL